MWLATDNVRAIDLWLGNRPQENVDLDMAAALSANPLIDYVVTRLAGGNSGADPSYPSNYDGVMSLGRAVDAYPVINPLKKMDAMFLLWKTAVANRIPKVFWWDCELDGGLSAAAVTKYIREVLRLAKIEWPQSRHGIYTAPWWWDPHVVHGWEAEFDLWTAQYPFERMTSASEGEQYEAFEPMVAKLPIGNSFTPALPRGWKEEGVQPVMWQFSERGKQRGVAKRVDLNLVNRGWFMRVHKGEASVPVPVQKIIVEVRRPATVELRDVVVA